MEDDEYADKWIDRRCRQVPAVTLDGVAKATTPKRKAASAAYAILLSSIHPSWPIPLSVKRKLEAAHLDGMHGTTITCSVSMSFYHTASKRFYAASTYHGHEHRFSIKRGIDTIPMDNFNELVYFHSSLDDPNCYAVIELVMSLLSPLDGSVSKSYSCGWALVNPFDRESIISTGNVKLNCGTPQDLLKGGDVSRLEQLTKANSSTSLSMVVYTIWRLEDLAEQLASCLGEDEIVGAHATVGGLRKTTIDYFDSRDCTDKHCIGASTRGNVLDWTLLPTVATISASPSTMRVGNIVLTVPQRLQFEKALTAWVAHSVPTGNIMNKMSSIFGWSNRTKGDENREVKDMTSTKVTSRRLRIGVQFNGHTILQNQWNEVALYDNGDNSDHLQAKGDVEISNYVDHQSCVMMYVVEYTLDTAQTKGLQSSKKATSTTVVVGMSVFCPSRGNVREVKLNLVNDSRCQALSTNQVYSPAQDEPLTLSFGLSNHKNRNSAKTSSRQSSEETKLEHNFDDSISLDHATSTKFVQFNSDGLASPGEAKEDFGSYASDENSREEMLPEASSITFEDSITLENCLEPVHPTPSCTFPSSSSQCKEPSIVSDDSKCSYSVSVQKKSM